MGYIVFCLFSLQSSALDHSTTVPPTYPPTLFLRGHLFLFFAEIVMGLLLFYPTDLEMVKKEPPIFIGPLSKGDEINTFFYLVFIAPLTNKPSG